MQDAGLAGVLSTSMKFTRILTALSIICALGITAAGPVFAAAPPSVTSAIGSGLQSAAQGAGYVAPGSESSQGNDLPRIVGSIIGILLQVTGVLLIIYLVYAGFLWMTAGGDKAKVEKATTTIRDAIIGLIVIALAYAIASYVVTQLGVAVNNGGTGTTQTPKP